MITVDPSVIATSIIGVGLVGLVADHFRIRGELAALRLHVAENVVSNKDAEKIEHTLASVVERLDKMVVQLARMEGAMGVQQTP